MLSELQHLPDRTAWPEPLRLAYRPPEWSYWTNLADATLEELVCLSLDLDPFEYLGEEPDTSRIVKMTLVLARYHPRLSIAKNNVQAGILLTRINVKPYRACFADFVCWANSLKPAWELPEALIAVAELHRPTQPPPGRGGKWPWGDHETELLRHLAAAAEKFWKNYDPEQPDTAPTNEQVAEWLASRGVSRNMASSIATLLRADKLPTGPPEITDMERVQRFP